MRLEVLQSPDQIRAGGDPSPETQARAIADKYLRDIGPEEHDKYETPKEVGTLIYLAYCVDPKIRTDVMNTADTVRKLAMFPLWRESPKRRTAELDHLTHDTVGYFSGTGKFSPFSELPNVAIRTACIKIALEEGPHSLKQILERVMEKGSDVSPDRLMDTINEQGSPYVGLAPQQLSGDDPRIGEKDIQGLAVSLSFRELDGIRKQALRIVLEVVYPRLMNSLEMNLLRSTKEIPYGNQEDPKIVSAMVQRFKEMTGDSSLDIFTDVESFNDETLQKAGFYGASEVLGQIGNLLEERLSKLLTKKE